MNNQRIQDLILLALIVIGCLLVGLLTGCVSPTAASDVPTHPNEILITEYTQCFAKWEGLPELKVYFVEDLGMTPCGTGVGMCPAAGRASQGIHRVTYWGPWVRGERPEYPVSSSDLLWVAAHEVAHVRYSNLETIAQAMAVVAVGASGCGG
jgi:hypothetical protein